MRRIPRQERTGEEGIALITTLLVVLVVGALVMGAVILGSNHLLADRYWSRQSTLVGLADAGLEITRAHLNGNSSLFPDSGFVTVEDQIQLQDGDGHAIPGVTRSTYVGPTEITPGRGGVSGSIVSVVRDAVGGVAVRRQQIFQESFAKFAYFTDEEGGHLFSSRNQPIWGPLHSNDQIRIPSPGATFHEEVTTAKDIQQPWYGIFEKGYQEHTPVIPMPGKADLLTLKQRAQAGHTAFLGDMKGGEGEATTRIEFLALDLNADGDETDEDEGFFRVYRSDDYRWVASKPQPREVCTDSRWGGTACDTVLDLVGTLNCGDYHTVDGVEIFVPAADHDAAVHGHDGLHALRSSSRRCYLGGSDRIWNGFMAEDGKGRWLTWDGSPDPRVLALRPDDARYLHPLTRSLNPDFNGVIYVEGKVMISGKIRGRVTVAASGNIILGDDLTYATDPGAGACEDVAGYVSGQKVVVSNNSINAAWRAASGESYRTYDESAGEFLHGVVLALDLFTAEDYSSGSESAQSCEETESGRGCLYLTGGVIQGVHGTVGLDDGRGYVERYSYDKCAALEPPPFFPTTGEFVKGQYYQVNPTGFDISAYWDLMGPGTPDPPSE